jgi:phosphatidylinositol glycan class Z
LFLIFVRLYFALSPSYLHPDENFQGPEVIAGTDPQCIVKSPIQSTEIPHYEGSHITRSWSDVAQAFHSCLSLRNLLTQYFVGQIFSYPVKLTWEFTSDQPVRSVFPLWPVYGLPMLLLRWLWNGNGEDGEVAPMIVFWTLRVLMFVLSFVLEDWAIHELIPSPRHRKVAVLLVASSYVTWTYQTHTFSNSIETLAVAWSLVLIQRIDEDKVGQTGYGSYSTCTDFRAATIFDFRIGPPGLSGSLWNIQPHYISGVFVDSWSSFDTPFLPKVGHETTSQEIRLTEYTDLYR